MQCVLCRTDVLNGEYAPVVEPGLSSIRCVVLSYQI